MPLLEYLDPIPRIFAPFQLEHMRYRWMTGVLLPCNWKTALDGFLEAYHLPGTHPQLFRLDKSNTHLATLKEIDNRIWSPTTTYERHAHYSSVGKKKSSASAGSAKDPSMRETNGVRDERLAVALAVQYIQDDMRGLETERSWRAAEALKTADVPDGSARASTSSALPGAVGGGRLRLAGDHRPAVGRSRHRMERVPQHDPAAQPGVDVRLPGAPYGLDPDRCLFEIFSLDQVPVAEYEAARDFKPEFYEDYREPAWRGVQPGHGQRQGGDRRACTPPASTATG